MSGKLTRLARRIDGKPGKVLLCIVVVAVLALPAAVFYSSSTTNHVAAYFRSAAGIYVGDRVMILGVPVGEIDSIEPDGDRVRIEFQYDGRNPVPADARAAIVAPTLVTGRYIQLAPAYVGGPRMADDATIPLDRTATPVEFDEIKKQLVQLSDDVGPTDQDEQGALNRFLDASADTLEGNGAILHDALTQLSQASQTLNAGGNDLFSTVDNLATVTTSLSTADEQIRGFSTQLANLSGVLNDNRTELDALLGSMNAAFGVVQGFVAENREILVNDVTKANTVTRLLVDRVDSLAQILHAGPNALSNLYNIYDPIANSLTGALAIPDIPDPKSLICALLTTVNAPESECITATRNLTANVAAAAPKAVVQPQPKVPTIPKVPTTPNLFIPGLTPQDGGR
jgi:phospholipid/cholesterol/gamma-HCH transport system substrate-binding protein